MLWSEIENVERHRDNHVRTDGYYATSDNNSKNEVDNICLVMWNSSSSTRNADVGELRILCASVTVKTWTASADQLVDLTVSFFIAISFICCCFFFFYLFFFCCSFFFFIAASFMTLFYFCLNVICFSLRLFLSYLSHFILPTKQFDKIYILDKKLPSLIVLNYHHRFMLFLSSYMWNIMLLSISISLSIYIYIYILFRETERQREVCHVV